MKSIKKILLVAVLFISVLVLSGCTNKKPITADEFYTMMKGKNSPIALSSIITTTFLPFLSSGREISLLP